MNNEELVLLYQQGNKQALGSLIDNNGGLIRKISIKYNNLNIIVELDDLIQSGTIGLITAANKYDSNMQNKANFITYAFYFIEREIYICANGKSSKNINNTKFYKTVKSLNILVGEEEETELLDMIDSHDKSMENVEDQLYLKQLKKELEEAMIDSNTLKEREILKLHYGWNIEPLVSMQIADILKLSQKEIIYGLQTSLRKLRNSKWGRTIGVKYRDEIIGPYRCNYRDVEKKFDEELKSLYAM